MPHEQSPSSFQAGRSPNTKEAGCCAAQSNGMVRLVFPKEPLLLERIDVQRIEPGCIRLAGRVSTK